MTRAQQTPLVLLTAPEDAPRRGHFVLCEICWVPVLAGRLDSHQAMLHPDLSDTDRATQDSPSG